MSLDFRNINTLWASILAETLQRLGLTQAVICPGSRSTPLTIAFAQHPLVEAIPILDERSAAFFALGLAKRQGLPVALICTSGTAGANFYPAVIEAKESRIPLLILTADRPPELRHCHAGQTIDQVKLYGHYPNWQAELAVPEAKLELLSYLRQTLIHAWERSLFPVPGVVHLNLPFREPLAPLPQPEIQNLENQWQSEDFFAHIYPHFPIYSRSDPYISPSPTTRGIIIAGVAHAQNPETYCQAIAYLSQLFNYPVLTEALSPVRNYQEINPYLICSYDLILRNPILADKLAPDLVIQLGELPTSKELRTWLEVTQPQRWIIDPSGENLDALQGKSIHVRTSLETWVKTLASNATSVELVQQDYLDFWCEIEEKMRYNIDITMESLETLQEGKIPWLLSQYLPPKTPVFIANSMPVRDAEIFWKSNNLKITPYFSRGANGIDGTLSTALGIAHQNQSSVLLTGDLALLHDTNGFLIAPKFKGHLTIILINNNGGGIFEMLPIAEFEPPFEDFFATPQLVNFNNLCLVYPLEYKSIQTWSQLIKSLNPLPTTGIRVLEVKTNRKSDAKWLKNTLKKLTKKITF
jgi:2-succinyl-5-enolpyruvyl-6-hydroxy-3-cyclohexene-1-carboxylate synthase